MPYPHGRMIIVSRAGPFSAISAFAMTSWYHFGKSVACGVRTSLLTPRILSQQWEAPSCMARLHTMDRMGREPLHDYVSRGFGPATDLYERIRPDYPDAAVDILVREDRKSTRLNSSHLGISYAVFCLKKK